MNNKLIHQSCKGGRLTILIFSLYQITLFSIIDGSMLWIVIDFETLESKDSISHIPSSCSTLLSSDPSRCRMNTAAKTARASTTETTRRQVTKNPPTGIFNLLHGGGSLAVSPPEGLFPETKLELMAKNALVEGKLPCKWLLERFTCTSDSTLSKFGRALLDDWFWGKSGSFLHEDNSSAALCLCICSSTTQSKSIQRLLVQRKIFHLLELVLWQPYSFSISIRTLSHNLNCPG